MPKTDEADLTDADAAALDKAWETITDADIEASIRWDIETARESSKAKTPEKTPPQP
jgi:hypothetical protein